MKRAIDWLVANAPAITKTIEIAALLWIATSLHHLATDNDLYLLRYVIDHLDKIADRLDDIDRTITLR